MKKLLFILPVILCLVSCSKVYRYTNDTFFAMSTVVDVVKSQEIKEDNTQDIILGIEKRMSRTISDSEIFRINNGEDTVISDDTLEVVEKSFEIAENTGYAFNPCMGTVAELWDITSGKNYVPTHEEIQNALSLCDAKSVKIEDGRVIKPDGMKIDLGGIAKGYALEKAANSMDEAALKYRTDPDYCINLGGNVAAFGSSASMKKQGKNGWNVGITNPFDKTGVVGTLTLCGKYIAISGAYERFFEKDGEIYHHIFDPATGYPAKSDLASVAIISDSAVEGDALSTALFVMGLDKAVEFYKSEIYDFDMILISNDGIIYITEDIFPDFTPDADARDLNGKEMPIIEIVK